MSMDTIALFQVLDAKRAVDAILESALTMPDALCTPRERFAKYWLVKEWNYDRECLRGPGGFVIRPKGRIIDVYHLLKFSWFTQQDEDGRIVLEAFHFIGHVIGSAEMIVCHELLPHEGDDLNAIADYITNEIGPSAGNWDELDKSSAFEPRCWMRLNVRTAV